MDGGEMSFYEYKDKEDWIVKSDYSEFTDEINDLRGSVKLASVSIKHLRERNSKLEKENAELKDTIKELESATEGYRYRGIEERLRKKNAELWEAINKCTNMSVLPSKSKIDIVEPLLRLEEKEND